MEGNLKEFQNRYGIKRIDFDKVKPTGLDETYAEDRFICPYCGTEMEFESEDTDRVLRGMTCECIECGKYFRVEAEVTINTTCTPIEDHVLERWVRSNIEGMYAHDDECNAKGLQWDLSNRYGVVEWEVYADYAMPIFHNAEMDKEE